MYIIQKNIYGEKFVLAFNMHVSYKEASILTGATYIDKQLHLAKIFFFF